MNWSNTCVRPFFCLVYIYTVTDGLLADKQNEEEVQAGVLETEESGDEGGGGPEGCGVFCIKGGERKSNDEVMYLLGENPEVVMHLLGRAETGHPTTTVDEGGAGGGGCFWRRREKGQAYRHEGATVSEGGGVCLRSCRNRSAVGGACRSPLKPPARPP